MSDVSRRTFLKLMGASGAVVVSGCSPRQLQQPVAAVPPGWIRGEERFIPTTCLQCPSGCGLRVRVYEGRAVKIDGNPAHPLNIGRLCPKGQAGLQVLYDPDRIRGPMKKIGGRDSREFQSITWDEAIAEVSGRLRQIRANAKPHAVLVMTGHAPEATKQLVSRFVAAYGTPNLVDSKSLSDDTVRLGNEYMMGVADHLGYDLENSNYLICFGANFLEGWRPTTYLLRMYGLMRSQRPGRRPKIVIVDPRYSVGASKADEWIPIRPGTDAALALGIAHVIVAEELYDKRFVPEHCFGFDDWADQVRPGRRAAPGSHRGFKELVKDYTPERVEQVTGVPAATVVRLAREFASAKPAVAAAGRGAGLHTNGLFNCMSVAALNALVGSIDTPGGVVVQRRPPLSPLPELLLDDDARSGGAKPRIDLHFVVPERLVAGDPYPIEMALVYYTNPLFSGPETGRYREAFRKIPYIVSFSPFLDETTEQADIVLPDHTYLERLDLDLISPSLGYPVLNLRQPVVEPLYSTRNTGDVLIEIAHGVGGSVKASFPWRNFSECLDSMVAGVVASTGGSFAAKSNADFWDTFKQKGVWTAGPYRFGEWEHVLRTPSGRFEFFSQTLKQRSPESGGQCPDCEDGTGASHSGDRSANADEAFMPHFEPPRFAGDPSQYPFYLNTFKTMMHAEGRGANQPWLQDSFGVQLTMAWEAWVALNPDAARELGITDGDAVWVESPVGRIKIRARLDPGTAPDIVTIPYEYGHAAYGRWARTVGGNPNEITSAHLSDPAAGTASLYATRVKVYRG